MKLSCDLLLAQTGSTGFDEPDQFLPSVFVEEVDSGEVGHVSIRPFDPDIERHKKRYEVRRDPPNQAHSDPQLNERQ